jgi:hypothetical protein
MNSIGLLDEIKSGKYVGIFLCVFIILIYQIYKNMFSCKNKIETMVDLSDSRIAEVVKRFYLSDEFIKNMSVISTKIETEGLNIIGNISVNGQIKATKEISANNYSLTGLNTKINNTQEIKQKQAEERKKVEAARLVEVARQAEAARQLEAARQAEIARQAEAARLKAEADRKAQSTCNINPQPLLGNKTCNHWSWKDERWEQRFEMPNYRKTGTVPPAWDCWYEPTTQCVSRDCLKSNNPAGACGKRTNWTDDWW